MQFKVFGISENTNAFGLRAVRLLNRQGHFYEVASNSVNLPVFGAVVHVPVNEGVPAFHECGWEIPERKSPDAPQEVIDTVWDESFAAKYG